MFFKRKKKYDFEKLEFLPLALEVAENPPSKTVRIFMYIFIIFVVIGILFMTLAKVDVIISGEGEIFPENGIIKVASPSASVVHKVFVKEGEKIERGQPLISLRNPKEVASLNLMQEEEELKTINMLAFSYLYKIEKKIDTQKVSDLIKTTASKIQIEYKEKISEIETSISKKYMDINTIKTELIDLKSSIKVARKSYYKAKRKYEKRIISEVSYLKTKNAYSKMGNTILLKNQQHKNLLKQYKKLQIQKETLTQKFILQKRQSYLHDIEGISIKTKKIDLKKNYIIYNDFENIHIGDISIFEGSYVSMGTELLQLIPHTNLEFKGGIKNSNRRDIKVGDKAFIKLSAFPFTKYGLLEGVISYISPNTTKGENQGSAINKIRVKITKIPSTIQLKAGDGGIIEIRLEKRTILEYFLSPIKKTISNALRER